MSAKNNLIDDFLEKVKNKLPEWLKDKPDQINEILFDLEQQIREKAIEISGLEEPTQYAIEKAIYAIGPPDSIAKVYKKRGTPKYYITEELWDFYLRALLFSLAVVVVINFIRVVFQFFFKVWYLLILDFFSGVYIGFLIVIVIVSGLFVFLSMEGYLPEDFGDLPRHLGLIIQYKTAEMISERERKELITIETKEKMREIKVKAKESLIHAKENIIDAQEKISEARIKTKKKIRTVSTGDLIAGFVLGIIFGLVCIIQPFYTLEPYFELEFLEWLRFFGLVVLIGALIELIRLAIGADNVGGQKVMLVINGLYNIAYFPLLIYLINHPDIFPIYLLSGFQISSLSPGLILDIYHWVGAALSIILILTIFFNIYKAARLGEEIE